MLHNHFIIKSLALTRPGGVVAVLSSHYTMDAANPAARREIAGMADLVAAVRLPMSAHQKAAGTQVITDVLVLRRRDPADGPGDASEWDSTVAIGGDAERQVLVNRYFAEHHPHHLIGEVGTRSGQFGPELSVTVERNVDDELPRLLRDTLKGVVAQNPSSAGGLFAAPLPLNQRQPVPAAIARGDAALERQEGHLAVDTTAGRPATFTVVTDGTVAEHQVPKSQAKELTALLGLRDTTMALLTAEAAMVDDTDQLAELRAQLNTRYDTYVKQWGPITGSAGVAPAASTRSPARTG